MTPESQQAVAGQMVFVLGMVGAFDPEKKDSVTQLFEKHGISEDGPQDSPPKAAEGSGSAGMMRAIGSMVESPAAFVADAITWMNENSDGEKNEQWGAGELGEITTDGDSASAPLTTDSGEAESIEFRKGDTGWLVHIPDEEFDMGGAAGGDVDFAASDDFTYHYDEEEELPDPQPITTEAFTRAWQTSVDFQERPAAEVLAEVASEAGLTVFDTPDLEEQLQQPVTVKLENVSRLQVIEAICEQAGLYPRYKLKTVAVAEGPRPFPVTFAGPFLVAVDDVEQLTPYPVGSLSLQFFAAGIPLDTAAQITSLSWATNEHSEDKFTQRLEPLTGGGKTLAEPTGGGYTRRGSRSTVLFNDYLDLRNLLKSVEAIDAIKGELSWPFPTEIKTLKFPSMDDAAVAEEGDIRLVLTKAPTKDRLQMRLEIEGVSNKSVTIVGRDASGNAIDNNFSSASDFGGKKRLTVQIEEMPSSLEARIVTKSDRATFSYEIPSVPLPSFAEMPEVLEDLKINGDSPATIEVLNIGGNEQFKKLQVKTTNHTNKEIYRLDLKLEYLDPDGKVLKDWPGNHQSQQNRVLVDVEGSAEFELTAFFMPDEATSARVSVKQIEFADGTEWSLPESE